MFRTLLVPLTAAAATAGALLVAIGPSPAGAASTTGTAITPSSVDAAPLCPRVPGRMWCLSERAGVTAPSPVRAGGMRAYATAAATGGPYGPADLRSAYSVPATTVTTTVAVVDAYDAPNVEADLAAYRAQFGLPPCTTANGCFRKVNQYGAAAPLPPTDSGWAGEATLDVSMVSAICPTCHILLVEANDDDSSGQPSLETAVQTAVSLGARYVSLSWGTSEWGGQLSADRTYLSAPGVTYVAAAGDSGYRTSWPAANPNVVAVGGTALVRAPGTKRGWSESVWSTGSSTGTGSGCSSYEPRPAWQALPAITGVCGSRAMNDVAVVADPSTGVYVTQSGRWYVYGGTSVGAPIIAAMEAIAGTSGGAAAYPYAHASAFNDVTGGASASCGSVLCTAGPGWDGPTGVGTPAGLTGLGPYTPPAGMTAPSASPAPTRSAAPTSSSAPAPPATGAPPAPTWTPSSPAPARPVGDSLPLHNPGPTVGYAHARAVLDVRATGAPEGSTVSYRASGLPPGTAVHHTGFITGRPARVGTYRVSVVATDAAGDTGRVRFRWAVRAHRIVPTRTPHTAGVLATGHTVRAVWGSLRKDRRDGHRIHPRVRVQWYVDGRLVRGATKARFTIPGRYSRHRISFRITASASYYAPYIHTTPPSTRIR